MKCDKCGVDLRHFSGWTGKYHSLCKPCYDEELCLAGELELRASKKTSTSQAE